jgi:hypothetical protein
VASRLLITLSLFNNVLAPCLAVLLVSSECFYYVITAPPSVEVSYEFTQCEGIYKTITGLQCVGSRKVTHSSSYLPGFSYSFQCSSSLLANFVGVYLLRYLITGVFVPLMTFVFRQGQIAMAKRVVQYEVLKHEEHETWQIFFQRELFRFFSRLMPPAVRILDKSESVVANLQSFLTVDEGIVDTVNPMSVEADMNTVDKGDKIKCKVDLEHIVSSLSLSVLPSDPNQVFMARKFTTILVGDVAILLTFGSIYPPLAVVVCISLIMNSVTVQLVLGRFISLSQLSLPESFSACLGRKELCRFSDVIQRETAAVGALIALSVPPITILAALFWSFFLFDILGDEVGAKNAVWIVWVLEVCLIVIMLPLRFMKGQSINSLFQSIRERILGKFSQHHRGMSGSSSIGGIELRDSSVIASE